MWNAFLKPALLICMAAAALASARENGETPPVGKPGFAAMERRILEEVNHHRRKRNVLPLGWKETVAVQCRQHSRNMALGLVPPGHEGGRERIGELRKALRVIAFAENVALTRGAADPVRDIMTGWVKSPGHRKAIEGDFDFTGVGIVMKDDSTYCCTQIFIKSR